MQLVYTFRINGLCTNSFVFKPHNAAANIELINYDCCQIAKPNSITWY